MTNIYAIYTMIISITVLHTPIFTFSRQRLLLGHEIAIDGPIAVKMGKRRSIETVSSPRQERPLAQFLQQVVPKRLARCRLFPSDLIHRHGLVIQVVGRRGFEGAAGHDKVSHAKHAGAVDERVGLPLRFGQRALGRKRRRELLEETCGNAFGPLDAGDVDELVEFPHIEIRRTRPDSRCDGLDLG